MKGKRELNRREGPSIWEQYREYVEEMSRAQRIRRRILQVLTGISIVIIAVAVFLAIWVKPPESPTPGTPSKPVTNTGDTSAGIPQKGNRALAGQNEGDPPVVSMSGQRDGVYTFLLVGRDTGGGGLTDTILLLTYDVNAKTITGLNIPRDTMLNVKTTSKRINAVYNYNKGSDPDTQVEKGMSALKKQVSKLTGIVPDFYVMVEWDAVGKLVDALGGVYFDVPFDMNYDDPYQNLHIHQQAGYRKLSGDDAMQVIRHRKNNDGSHSDGDVGRLKVQQDFLKAAAAECLKPSTLLKAPARAQIFMENVATELDVGNILYFAQMAMGMDAEEGVTFVTMPYVDARHPSASMVLPIESALLAILNDGMNPYLDKIQSSDLELLYRKSGGGYGVTNGTLADPNLAYAPRPKPDPEPEPDPELPEDPVVDPGPDQEQNPDQSSGENPDPGIETPPPGVPLDPIDPSDVFPELPDPEPTPEPEPEPEVIIPPEDLTTGEGENSL